MSASNRRSASRLKAIAALRAVAMQTKMPSRSSQRNGWGGSARRLADHAMAAAKSANGKAKSVWLKRMSSSRRTSIGERGEGKEETGQIRVDGRGMTKSK